MSYSISIFLVNVVCCHCVVTLTDSWHESISTSCCGLRRREVFVWRYRLCIGWFSLLVGAPRDNGTSPWQLGMLYSCPLTSSTDDCTVIDIDWSNLIGNVLHIRLFIILYYAIRLQHTIKTAKIY